MTSPQPASAPTSAPKNAPAGDRLVFIDYLRAVAVLQVVGFHLLIDSFGGLRFLESKLSFWDGNWHHLLLASLPFCYGYTGVAIFFVISGFCIHLNFRKATPGGLKPFFIRRFFRLYPAYFLALCFFTFVLPNTRLAFDSPLNVAQFVSHVLMVHNFDHRSFFSINGTFWTLAVEVQLYLIYPLLLLIARRWGWTKALALTAAVELGLRGLSTVVTLPYLIGGSPFFYWFSWAVGAKLAEDYVEGRRPALASIPWWVCLLLVMLVYKASLLVFIFPAVALLAAAVIAHLILHPERDHAPTGLFGRSLRQIGVISYSLYLLHGPPLAYIDEQIKAAFPTVAFSPLATSIYLLAACVPVFLICWLCHRWVELPSVTLGKSVNNWYNTNYLK